MYGALAFVAGLVSFLSPCVLPLVPGYLSLISGLSFDEILHRGDQPRVSWRILLSSCLFVLGFSAVFAALGAFASGLASPLAAYLPVLRRVAGVVVMLFGLHAMRVLPIRALYVQKSIDVGRVRSAYFGPIVVGMAFAFGWTPCVGPILASLLALAASEGGIGRGMELLFVYALGIGVPFVAVGLGMGAFVRALRRYGRVVRAVEIGSGALLLGVGALIFTNGLVSLTAWLPFLNRFVL